MSGIVTALAVRNPKSTMIRQLNALTLTFDELVATFSNDLVHYWKFQVPSGTIVTDEQGLTNATITGSPQRDVQTLVLGDTLAEGAAVDGKVIAWPGTIGEYAEAAHNAVQKTASGTIILYAQFDTLNQKSQLMMGDATSVAGGFAFGVNSNGAADAHLRGVGGTPATVSGSTAGDIQLNRAYCFMFKWSASGIELVIFNDAGVRIRRATNTSATGGLSGTSAIRFGASHDNTNHHDGPYGRVIWLDRSISAAEEELFGQRTLTNLGTYRSLEIGMTPIALWGMGDGSGATVLRDAVGTRHGTYTGVVTAASDLPTGVTDGAVSFDGVATATVAHDAGLLLNALTLSFWFRTNSMLQGEEPAFYRLLAKDSGLPNTAGDFFAVYHEDGYIRVQFQDGTNNHTWESSPGSVILSTDHHVSVRSGATGTIVTLDGQEIPEIFGFETTYTQAWISNTQALRFAHSSIPAEGIGHITLDEVLLIPRVITNAQVLSLAQRTAVLPVAVNDSVDVAESDLTPIDVVANDQFSGSKAALTVQIMSQPAGGDSVAVNGNNDIAYTSGAVASNTVRSFTYRITDGNGTSNTATCTVTVINEVAPVAGDLPFFGQYYGGGWPSFSNGELEFRGTPYTFFFRAERSGTIDGIRWYWRTQAPDPDGSYSLGNGGTYTIEIRTANPTTKLEAAGSTLICRVAGLNPGNPSGNNEAHPEYNFSTTGAVVAGNPYVIKIINTHSNPAGNYVSTNAIRYFHWNNNFNPPNFTEPGGGGAVGQIRVASGGMRGNAVGGAGGTIKRVHGYAPHMIDAATDYLLYPVPTTGQGANLRHDRLGGVHCSVRYADGVYTGWGKGSGEYPANRLNVTGSTQVRQRFRVTRAPRTVSGVFVYGWINGTAGTLNVILEQGPQTDAHFPNNAASTVIETVPVAANWFLNLGTNDPAFNQAFSGSDSGALDLFHYVWVPFGSNRTLALGQTYNLRLAAVGACNFYILASNRDDGKYTGPLGRNTATWTQWANSRRITWTSFEDSRGPQISTNGGSTWAYLSGSHQQIPITFKIA